MSVGCPESAEFLGPVGYPGSVDPAAQLGSVGYPGSVKFLESAGCPESVKFLESAESVRYPGSAKCPGYLPLRRWL